MASSRSQAGMAQMGLPKDITWGFLTKQGAVRKNWKARWMVLKDNGMLYYYRTNKGNEVPLGAVNVKGDCIDLLSGDACKCSWPDKAPSKSGFGLVTTSRVFYMYSGNEDYAKIWIEKLTECSDQLVKRQLERQKTGAQSDGKPQIDSAKPPSTTESIMYEAVREEQGQDPSVIYEETPFDRDDKPHSTSKPRTPTPPAASDQHQDIYDDIRDVATALDTEDLYEDVLAGDAAPGGVAVQKGRLSLQPVDSGSEDEDIYEAIAEVGEMPPLPPREYEKDLVTGPAETTDSAVATAAAAAADAAVAVDDMYDDIEELQREVLTQKPAENAGTVADSVSPNGDSGELYDDVEAYQKELVSKEVHVASQVEEDNIDEAAPKQDEAARASQAVEQELCDDVAAAGEDVAEDLYEAPVETIQQPGGAEDAAAVVAPLQPENEEEEELYDAVDPPTDGTAPAAAAAAAADVPEEDCYEARDASGTVRFKAREFDGDNEEDLYVNVEAVRGHLRKEPEEAGAEQNVDVEDHQSKPTDQKPLVAKRPPVAAKPLLAARPAPATKPKPGTRPRKTSEVVVSPVESTASEDTTAPAEDTTKPAHDHDYAIVDLSRKRSRSKLVEPTEEGTNGQAEVVATEQEPARQVSDDQEAVTGKQPAKRKEEKEAKFKADRERRLSVFREEQERQQQEAEERARIRKKEILEREQRMRQQFEEEARQLELEVQELEELEDAEIEEGDAEALALEEEELKRQQKLMSFLERDKGKRERLAAEKSKKGKEETQRLRHDEEWLRQRQKEGGQQ